MDAVSLESGQIKIAGDIDYHTVAEIRAQGEQLIRQQQGQVVVDMGAVERVNTSALALILSWQRTAKNTGIELDFVNIPSSLTAIAAMSDLDSLLE